MRLAWPTGRAEDLLQRVTILIACLGLAGLVALAIVAFVSSQDAAKQALDTRDQTAASASRRIDGLQADLKLARAELELAKAQRGELIAKVDALAAQIIALGGRPVSASQSSGDVTTPRESTPTRTTTTTTAPPPPQSPPTTQPQPDPAPGPQPQPQPQPEPEPQPFPCRTVFVPVLCSDTATNRKARA